jgi:hypothetical protein
MKNTYRFYQSYLVRLWKEGAESDWRASIQDIASGECKYFSQLGELFLFMEQNPETALLDQHNVLSRPSLAEF